MENYYKLSEVADFHVWDMEDFDKIDSVARYNNSWMKIHIPKGSKVLDIGCGPGYTTKILHDNGIEILGVDLNEAAIQKAQKNGLPVVCADALQIIENRGHEFDFFLMSDFIEHVPLEVVYNIFSKIKKLKQGKIFLCTPNLDSLMGFKFWFHMPTHINPMHPFVIKKMLANLGYTILAEWSEYGNLPGKGWKYKFRKKILELMLGTQAQLFVGGANINYIVKI